MAPVPHIPTDAMRQMVVIMAGYGVLERDIARAIGIGKTCLQRHYRHELDTGHVKANAQVAMNLFRIATSDTPQAVSAAMFWLKCRARWRTTPDYEPPAPDETPSRVL